MAEEQSPNENLIRWPMQSLVAMLGVFALFALAYSQAPLYTSNQNQYFLHGAATAGFGTLEHDWLANTVDPTPVFSALVQLTFLLRLPALFHIYYAVLLGVYLYSMWGLLQETLQPQWDRPQRWIVLGVLIAIHSFAFRFILSRALGQGWRFVLEGGFAGQRLLGTVFQPSTFGVLLLLGILLFLRKRTIPAIISVVLAATVHPTYLLSAALVILGFMFVSLKESRSPKGLILIGLVSLVLVSPILWYTWSRFQATSPRLAELASQILVETRIPNHVLLKEWFNLSVIFQSGLILLAIYLYRKHPISIILTTIAAAVFLLTLFQIETGNQRLALLFPWRPSALLVPVSSVLLLGFVSDRLRARIHPTIERGRRRIEVAVWLLLILLAGIGIGSYLHDLRGKRLDTARPMFEFIRVNHRPGDRFFIPPKQQDFRLATGAPILVDFKSIPYVDAEVIEWYDRLRTAQNFYRDTVDERNCVQIDKAVESGSINHVVLGPDQHGLTCSIFAELLFSDDSYQVYKIDPAEQ
ncbi:MAG: hypothetical protein P1P76_09715 [Anaerolineales bacterium]|nr:hypothetical protein [Anaerolineales bacterium]